MVVSTEASSASPTLLTKVTDAFQDLQDVPAPPPPASAPGPALLDDHETGMLDDFFEQMNTGQLDDSSFAFGGLGQNKTNSSWDIWPDELPPMFHGSTSLLALSDAQSTGPLQRSTRHHFELSQDHNFTGQQTHIVTTSPEILAAASTLVHNGHTGLSNGVPHRGSQQATNHTSQQSLHYHSNNAYGGTQAEFYHPRLSNTGPNIEKPLNSAVLNGDPILQSMFFGPVGPIDIRHTSSDKSAHLRWGSDANFYDHCFVAPPNQETVEEVTKTQLSMMECLEPQISAANTQPSSPMMNRSRRSFDGQNGGSSSGGSEKNVVESIKKHSAQLSTADSIPRKRRKNRLKIEPHDDIDEEKGEWSDHAEKTVNLQRTARRQSFMKEPKSKRQSLVIQDRGKRGKPQPSEQKSGRDNLTDEQKRSNHILSEQKRRNLIKQGFEDLCKLVPELKGGSFSKSAMLTQAADWLEKLVNGNEMLRQQLAEIKRDQRS